MAKEKIIDNLCALALNRYRMERRGAKVTREIKDTIHSFIADEYERSGEIAAYNYAKTANLLG